MISQLLIENVAVIERAEMSFSEGFNVFTGETGAGKSILIDSIGSILGKKTGREIIRNGAKKAAITAIFSDISTAARETLSNAGYINGEEDEIMIVKEITDDGKSNCRINNRLTTAAFLKELSGNLVTVYGQNDNRFLLDASSHILYIDAMGDYDDELSHYKNTFEKLAMAKAEYHKFLKSSDIREHQLELCKFQIDEITAANLLPDEEEELIKARVEIKNCKTIAENLSGAYTIFAGDDNCDGVLQSVLTAAKMIETASSYSPHLSEICEKAASMYAEIEDVVYELRQASDNLEWGEERLLQIEERLDVIYRLKKKYGGSVENVLARLDKISAMVDNYDNYRQKVEELKNKCETLELAAKDLAAKISGKRRICGENFARTIKSELLYLDMPNVEFVIKTDKSELNNNGDETVEFLISTNKGEKPKPLAKIASGGELSRIMLAWGAALGDKEMVSTQIFDEIDTGVSGRAAQKVGEKLQKIAKKRQVICVTHLASIASLADRHLLIKKNIFDDRTYTTVIPLEYEGRKLELARILGGDNITDNILATAHELLAGK